jgi:hypothetical protein
MGRVKRHPDAMTRRKAHPACPCAWFSEAFLPQCETAGQEAAGGRPPARAEAPRPCSCPRHHPEARPSASRRPLAIPRPGSGWVSPRRPHHSESPIRYESEQSAAISKCAQHCHGCIGIQQHAVLWLVHAHGQTNTSETLHCRQIIAFPAGNGVPGMHKRRLLLRTSTKLSWDMLASEIWLLIGSRLWNVSDC